MDIKELIPKHKDDQEVIDGLKALSFEQLRPIVPDLLELLQDLHWPIAHPIAEILAPFADRITPDIINVLKTNDGQWKWGVLTMLVRKTTDPVLLKEVERIARFPTRDELEEELNIEALAILNGD
ncbi:DUF5071 domain-containing protein [Paraflavitalea sp. CAU 1676]|uniref:DUF5071 domain-containing protein n=1 Tax=Paraflavitalea sp. CAU 1676 TaxID=3032598 RepID=UPI0023DB709D|nr:DUF5071 domain-containing protein [Paraflavitalea sp. CAU 1676]MDF2189235.1 DUF5071 domain-containing protein [Paraflavitalea sp. CAU 1676]